MRLVLDGIPCLPVCFKDMSDLSMCHAVFTSELECRTIHKVQHNRVWKLLAIEIWYVWHPKLRELILLGCPALMLHSLGYRECNIPRFVDLDYPSFPEL